MSFYIAMSIVAFLLGMIFLGHRMTAGGLLLLIYSMGMALLGIFAGPSGS